MDKLEDCPIAMLKVSDLRKGFGSGRRRLEVLKGIEMEVQVELVEVVEQVPLELVMLEEVVDLIMVLLVHKDCG